MKNQRNIFPSRRSKSNHCPPVATKKAMPTDIEDEIMDEKNLTHLDEDDIALLKTYGLGPYSTSIKKTEKDVKEMAKRINDLCGS
ncbi:26S proteasome regulatory subunit 7A isoform X2 [Lactuca sativa]|uniref:26S proteasome regulatory subunit 7A isoform X2 n=1 Tax=Lactuca sativa TaxID=4236 RepID=UPI000CD9D526|nr:26S proteasome regulatory subunit 7A isoform X2 [Lactuca sativa]